MTDNSAAQIPAMAAVNHGAPALLGYPPVGTLTLEIPHDMFYAMQSENQILRKRVIELANEKSMLSGRADQADAADKWLRNYNSGVVKKNDDLGRENALLKVEVRMLESEVIALRSEVTTLKATVEAHAARLAKLHARASLSWLRNAKDALGDLAICLAARVTEEELEESKCRGIEGLTEKLRQLEGLLDILPHREASSQRGGAYNTAVEAAVRRALNRIFHAGITDEEVWRQVARRVAADVTSENFIVQTALDRVPVNQRSKIYLPRVAFAAANTHRRYIDEAVRAGAKLVNRKGDSIARPAFDEIYAENLENHAVTAGLGAKPEMLALIAAFRKMYLDYVAMASATPSTGSGAMLAI